MVKEESLAFNVGCLKEMNPSRFRHYLSEAARDMRKVVEGSQALKSKL